VREAAQKQSRRRPEPQVFPVKLCRATLVHRNSMLNVGHVQHFKVTSEKDELITAAVINLISHQFSWSCTYLTSSHFLYTGNLAAKV